MENNTIPAQIPQNISKSTSRFSLSSVLVGLVLLFVGISFGFYLGKSQLPSVTSLNAITPTSPLLSPTSIPTIVQEDLTREKTYTDSKNNFSFKYPTDWEAKDIFSPTETFRVNINKNYSEGGIIAELSISSPSKKVDTTQLESLGITSKGETRTFGNLTGQLYETEGTGIGGSGYRIDFIFEHNSQTYWISLSTNLSNKDLYKNIFTQVVSSFKFLN